MKNLNTKYQISGKKEKVFAKGERRKARSGMLLIAAILIMSISLHAAGDDFWSNLFFDDFVHVGTAVIDDPIKSALIAGGVAGLTAIVMNNDKYIQGIIQDQKSDFNDTFMDAINITGNGAYVLAANTLFFFGSDYEKDTGRLVVETMAVASTITYLGKIVMGRNRPSQGVGPYHYNMFSFSDMSMPSGDVTVSFALATVLGDRYNIGYITYPVAALCMAARVYKNRHWPSDTIIGALVGTVVAKSILAAQDSDIKVGYDGNRIMMSYSY